MFRDTLDKRRKSFIEQTTEAHRLNAEARRALDAYIEAYVAEACEQHAETKPERERTWSEMQRVASSSLSREEAEELGLANWYIDTAEEHARELERYIKHVGSHDLYGFVLLFLFLSRLLCLLSLSHPLFLILSLSHPHCHRQNQIFR